MVNKKVLSKFIKGVIPASGFLIRSLIGAGSLALVLVTIKSSIGGFKKR